MKKYYFFKSILLLLAITIPHVTLYGQAPKFLSQHIDTKKSLEKQEKTLCDIVPVTKSIPKDIWHIIMGYYGSADVSCPLWKGCLVGTPTQAQDVWQLRFSEDGKIIVTESMKRGIQVWDVETKKLCENQQQYFINKSIDEPVRLVKDKEMNPFDCLCEKIVESKSGSPVLINIPEDVSHDPSENFLSPDLQLTKKKDSPQLL
jgi:hypothetical protein